MVKPCTEVDFYTQASAELDSLTIEPILMISNYHFFSVYT